MEGSWARCAHVPTLAARQLGMQGLPWVFGELLFLTRPQQRRSRVSLKAEGDLVELGREERGLGGTPQLHPCWLGDWASALSEGGAPGPLSASFCPQGSGRVVPPPQTYRSARSGAPSAGLAGARRYSGGTGSSGDALR